MWRPGTAVPARQNDCPIVSIRWWYMLRLRSKISNSDPVFGSAWN